MVCVSLLRMPPLPRRSTHPWRLLSLISLELGHVTCFASLIKKMFHLSFWLEVGKQYVGQIFAQIIMSLPPFIVVSMSRSCPAIHYCVHVQIMSRRSGRWTTSTCTPSPCLTRLGGCARSTASWESGPPPLILSTP